MEYIKAQKKDINQIFLLVQETIKTTYPKYYPKEVVDFFYERHNLENITKDIEKGIVGVLLVDDKIVGTACYKYNLIKRVYVAPEFQGKGYGSFIMQVLEDQIAIKYDTFILDSSLAASIFYENRGYRTVKHRQIKLENEVVLVYEVMEKKI